MDLNVDIIIFISEKKILFDIKNKTQLMALRIAITEILNVSIYFSPSDFQNPKFFKSYQRIRTQPSVLSVVQRSCHERSNKLLFGN